MDTDIIAGSVAPVHILKNSKTFLAFVGWLSMVEG